MDGAKENELIILILIVSLYTMVKIQILSWDFFLAARNSKNKSMTSVTVLITRNEATC